MTTKEHDVEAGTAFLPRIPLLRRKRVLTALCLAVPLLLLGLLYGYQTEASFPTLSLRPTASASITSTLTAPVPAIPATLTAPVPAINGLAGQLPAVDMKAESILLLLQALKDPNYRVGADWKDVYVARTPLATGLMGTINSAATNRFTDLLFKVGLPNREPVAAGVKNDALQLYRLSRTEWAEALRAPSGLTVFSKSYCPYSKRAKALLATMHANATVYEVDLRADAHELQPLLAALTAHTTFPTILAQDRLLGGADDLDALYRAHTLQPTLTAIGAL